MVCYVVDFYVLIIFLYFLLINFLLLGYENKIIWRVLYEFGNFESLIIIFSVLLLVSFFLLIYESVVGLMIFCIGLEKDFF